MVGVGVVIGNVGSAVETRSLGGNRTNLNRIRGLVVELGILVALRALVEAGILVARLRCIGGVRVVQYTMSTAFYFGILGSNESNKCHQQCFKKIVRESGDGFAISSKASMKYECVNSSHGTCQTQWTERELDVNDVTSVLLNFVESLAPKETTMDWNREVQFIKSEQRLSNSMGFLHCLPYFGGRRVSSFIQLVCAT